MDNYEFCAQWAKQIGGRVLIFDEAYAMMKNTGKLRFPDATFDAVTARQLDREINLGSVLGEIARVMKPQGKLLVVCPDKWPCRSATQIDDIFATHFSARQCVKHFWLQARLERWPLFLVPQALQRAATRFIKGHVMLAVK